MGLNPERTATTPVATPAVEKGGMGGGGGGLKLDKMYKTPL